MPLELAKKEKKIYGLKVYIRPLERYDFIKKRIIIIIAINLLKFK